MIQEEPPEWLKQAARDASEQIRLLQPYVDQARDAAEASRSMMPLVRYARDYYDQAQRTVDTARAIMPLLRYAQQNAEDLARAMAIVEPLLAYADQVRQALVVGMAEVAELASRQVAVPRHHTASASLTITPVFTATAVVAKAQPAEVRATAPDARAETARSVDLLAFELVLIWVVALVMPAAQLLLPPEVQAYINGLYATAGIALALMWRAQDKRKG